MKNKFNLSLILKVLIAVATAVLGATGRFRRWPDGDGRDNAMMACGSDGR